MLGSWREPASSFSGGLLSFVGTVWILQGINVLPGSFMTGQTRWAVIGGFTLLGGVLVLGAELATTPALTGDAPGLKARRSKATRPGHASRPRASVRSTCASHGQSLGTLGSGRQQV